MCVIVFVTDPKKRPSPHMIEQMWDQNDDGGGLAWREGTGVDTEVVWEKGLDLKQMKEGIAKLPTPFVAHFRVASVGGVCDELTHPFLVSSNVGVEKTGRTKEHVLFHNGDWKPWKESVLRGAEATGIGIPAGRHWSDSRALAWLTSVYGLGYMDFIDDGQHQKGIAFGPHNYEIYIGKGWIRVNDIWCSNDYFTWRPAHFCEHNTCYRKDINKAGWCPDHDPVAKVKQLNGNKVEGTGGSQGQKPSPFRGTAPRSVVTVEQAELMHKEGRLGKQALKRVRKYWEKENYIQALKDEEARKSGKPIELLPAD